MSEAMDHLLDIAQRGVRGDLLTTGEWQKLAHGMIDLIVRVARDRRDVIQGWKDANGYDDLIAAYAAAVDRANMAEAVAKHRMEVSESIESALVSIRDTRDAETARLLSSVAVRLYAAGYRHGHNDTVEGVFADVPRIDAEEYYAHEHSAYGELAVFLDND